jgi:uncharacterized membrane protein YeaQ/YmgE (transglycosylase-associated protein family)
VAEPVTEVPARGSNSYRRRCCSSPVVAQGDRVRLPPDLSSLVGYVLIGLVVGVLARLVVPGRARIGLLGTILIGIVGAVVGGWLAGEFFRGTDGVDWIASVVVAAILVLLVHSGTRRRPLRGRRL